MNITEANAVNVILQYVTQSPSWDGKLPSVDQVADAAEILAAKANKTLSAGITVEQVRKWRTT